MVCGMRLKLQSCAPQCSCPFPVSVHLPQALNSSKLSQSYASVLSWKAGSNVDFGKCKAFVCKTLCVGSQSTH